MTCAACSFGGLIVGLWLGVFGSVLVVMLAKFFDARQAGKRRGMQLKMRLQRLDADSPIGWGDKTLDGTGTGLVNGGDPPSMTDITMLGGPVPKRRKLT